MKTRHLALAAVALLVITLLATGAARADTFTYTYTSQQQLDLGNQPCDPCRVALSFTVATALAPSSTFTWAENGSTFANPLNPILNMSSDNFGGLSSAVNPSSIQVVTDKSGNIVSLGFHDQLGCLSGAIWDLHGAGSFPGRRVVTCGLIDRGNDHHE